MHRDESVTERMISSGNDKRLEYRSTDSGIIYEPRNLKPLSAPCHSDSRFIVFMLQIRGGGEPRDVRFVVTHLTNQFLNSALKSTRITETHSVNPRSSHHGWVGRASSCANVSIPVSLDVEAEGTTDEF